MSCLLFSRSAQSICTHLLCTTRRMILNAPSSAGGPSLSRHPESEMSLGSPLPLNPKVHLQWQTVESPLTLDPTVLHNARTCSAQKENTTRSVQRSGTSLGRRCRKTSMDDPEDFASWEYGTYFVKATDTTCEVHLLVHVESAQKAKAGQQGRHGAICTCRKHARPLAPLEVIYMFLSQRVQTIQRWKADRPAP